MTQESTWKTVRCDRAIDFDFPRMSAIVANDVLSFPIGEEAQIMTRLREHNVQVIAEIDLPIVQEETPSEPRPPIFERPPARSRVAEGLASRRETRPAQVVVVPPVETEVPLPAEEIEEEMQKSAVEMRAQATEIVEELTGLVRTSLSFYYKNLRDRVCEVAKQVVEKEREYLNLAVSRMTYGYVGNALDKVVSTGLDKQAKKVKAKFEQTGSEVTDEQIATAMTTVRNKVMAGMRGFTETQEQVDAQLKELVAFEVEKEELFREITSQKDINQQIKNRMHEELMKIAKMTYVENMWCEDSSFVVEVKDVKVLDPEENNREYVLGRYQIRLNLRNVDDGNILTIIHSETPNADYMHPHISQHGTNVCFGSGNTAEGIMKLLGEFDLALVIQVLYGFLNAYNPDSPYQKPRPLMEHWSDRDGWTPPRRNSTRR